LHEHVSPLVEEDQPVEELESQVLNFFFDVELESRSHTRLQFVHDLPDL
jgi:hypothetical protein